MQQQYPRPIEELEEKIGYKFKNREILITALTHSSYSNENKHKAKSMRDNERLEFLGDSVLSLIVSEFLFKSHGDFDEGNLTRTRAVAVCENSLYELATELDLGAYMLLGHGEIATQGRKRKSLLADAFEATLAAIYLDSGLEQARAYLMPRILPTIERALKEGNEDYKSILQRIVQQTPEEVLEYRMVGESGPPHDRIFEFEVYLNSNLLGKGTGRSKREAEQHAAREALILFGEIEG